MAQESLKLGREYNEAELTNVGLKRTKCINVEGQIFRHERGNEIYTVDESVRGGFKIMPFGQITVNPL